MAVRIANAESIRRAILADALLSAIIEAIEVNSSGRPPISLGASGAVIDLPVIDGIEAIWRLRIIGLTLEEISQVSDALHSLFPGIEVNPGTSGLDARLYSLVTDQVRQAVKDAEARQREAERDQTILDAVTYAKSLKDGRDGLRGDKGEQGPQGERGPAGAPGRDGKDLLATDAILDDLKDVFVPEPKIGHVLTWDGVSWVSQFVPQVYKYAGGGGAGGVEEAPTDGEAYLRRNGAWITLESAINLASNLDAGNFDDGTANANQLFNEADAGSFD